MALTVTQSRPIPGVELWVYDNLDTADSSPEVIQGGGSVTLGGSIQVVGTFGGGTVVLQGSNDNSNWVTLKDIDGTDISLTATGAQEFSTAMLYLRPLITGGTGDDVDVYITFRV